MFAQVVNVVHRQLFACCVERCQGNCSAQESTCREQFLCLAFAQLTGREGLRDIEGCLNPRPERQYRLGYSHSIARSTLVDANESRDWRIFADLAHALNARERDLYCGEDVGVELKDTIFALDSTTLVLCLSLFPWARYQRAHGAIKLHTLLDLRGPIPSFIQFSDGKQADVTVLDSLTPESGNFYLMDRGYVDLQRLFRFAKAGTFFVTRTKKSMRFGRHQSRPVDMAQGLRSDHTVRFATSKGRALYPDSVPRVQFKDPESGKSLILLTNNCDQPPLTIARLYKLRWRVELFSKWIQGHLRIQTFYATSANAMETQVWVAICVYVMVALLRKDLALRASLYTVAKLSSVHVVVKVALAELCANTTFATIVCHG